MEIAMSDRIAGTTPKKWPTATSAASSVTAYRKKIKAGMAILSELQRRPDAGWCGGRACLFNVLIERISPGGLGRP
ncbi:hypothetical protein GCM10027088_01230 [Nocardia goodfellowii]